MTTFWQTHQQQQKQLQQHHGEGKHAEMHDNGVGEQIHFFSSICTGKVFLTHLSLRNPLEKEKC